MTDCTPEQREVLQQLLDRELDCGMELCGLLADLILAKIERRGNGQ